MIQFLPLRIFRVKAVEGNYDVLREWYSNDISATAMAHIVEVLELRHESGKPLYLEDFADLSFLARTRENAKIVKVDC
jgi:hypothetical protein